MIWKTRLMTLHSVSRVNRPSRFATAPPAGALVVLPLTGGCRAERDWGRSQSVRKCAPKRQVREHMDAKGPICVRKCARSSFRRALTDANHLTYTPHPTEPSASAQHGYAIRLTAVSLHHASGGGSLLRLWLKAGYCSDSPRTVTELRWRRSRRGRPWGCRCRRWQRGRA